ncbi:hypothetical protein GQR58_008277 [Nymphon striatum]|nr:hypothetical protein GQR58_008277 [Nymphon striatum]
MVINENRKLETADDILKSEEFRELYSQCILGNFAAQLSRKSTVTKVLKKISTLESLGNPNGDIEDITAAVTVFAAKCYGRSVHGTMSDVQFDMWKMTTAKRKPTAINQCAS